MSRPIPTWWHFEQLDNWEAIQMSCWAPADVSIPQCFTRLCFASFSLLCVSIKLHPSHVPSTRETKLSLQGGPQARSAECQVGTSWGWLCLSSAFLQLDSPWHLLSALLTTSCTASPISRQLNINVQLSAHDKFVHMCICHICAHVHMTNANC